MLAAAILAVIVGAGLITAGAALVYPPAGLVVSGLLLSAAGLYVDFGEGERK